jgi:isoleucyl-tRNA synthetase
MASSRQEASKGPRSGQEGFAGSAFGNTVDTDFTGLGITLDVVRRQIRQSLLDPDLPSDDVKRYAQTGEISVDGIPLVAGDLIVTRYVDSTAKDFDPNTDDDAVILLDTRLHPELQEHFLVRASSMPAVNE